MNAVTKVRENLVAKGRDPDTITIERVFVDVEAR